MDVSFHNHQATFFDYIQFHKSLANLNLHVIFQVKELVAV